MGAFFRELLHVGIYKRSQGRITRQITFAAVALVYVLGLLRMSTIFTGEGMAYQYAIPLALLAVFTWATFRMVNVPAVADFLIAVEAEMNKVSWPTWSELFRASMVVIILIFSLGAILAGFDYCWKLLFVKVLGIL